MAYRKDYMSKVELLLNCISMVLFLACSRRVELRLLVLVGTFGSALFSCRCRMTGEQIPQVLLLPPTGVVQTIGTKLYFVSLQKQCIMKIVIK
jgi:hypothetical protein